MHEKLPSAKHGTYSIALGIRQLPRNALGVALAAAALFFSLGALFSRQQFSAPDLTFDNLSEIQTLDPATANGQKENRILIFLFEGLTVAHPQTLEPIPGVAHSWDISPDAKRYVFHLRSNARWANGDALTAQDFVYSWRRVLHPATGCDFPYLLGKVANASKFNNPDLLDPGDPVLLTLAGEEPIRGSLRSHRMRGRIVLLENRHEIAFEAHKKEGSEWTLDMPGARIRNATRLPPRRDDPLEVEIEGKIWKAKGTSLEEAQVELSLEGQTRSWENYESITLDPELLGLSAPDAQTFVVELETPVAYFLQATYLWPLLPVHAASIEAWKKRSPQQWRFEWIRPENLVGNGPYRILERRVNDRFLFEKNPLYWDAANVEIARIDAIAVESASTRLNLFEAGLVDWTQQIPIAVAPHFLARDRDRARSQRQLRNEPLLATYWYYCNVTRPPLNDRRVRLALAKSIDRERIVRYVTRAGQKPAHSLVPPLIPGYESAHGQDFDPHAAKRLLEEAGFPQGQGFPVLEILYDTNELHRDIAEVIQDEWRKHLGIEVKILNQEWKSYLDAQITHQFDISRGSWVADYRDPNTFLEIYGTGNGNNRSGFSDPRYDRILQEAAQEQDPAKRFALLRDAEQFILDEAPVIPLYFYVATNLVKPHLKGWHHNAMDMHFPKFWSIDRSHER